MALVCAGTLNCAGRRSWRWASVSERGASRRPRLGLRKFVGSQRSAAAGGCEGGRRHVRRRQRRAGRASSAANLSTAVNGASSGTLNLQAVGGGRGGLGGLGGSRSGAAVGGPAAAGAHMRKGSFGSDVSVTLKLTLAPDAAIRMEPARAAAAGKRGWAPPERSRGLCRPRRKKARGQGAAHRAASRQLSVFGSLGCLSASTADRLTRGWSPKP